MIIPPALEATKVTLLGYGALLSESSSRLTFPDLTNFRYARVKHLRRVFSHPHIFLLEEGLVSAEDTLHLASLSAEKVNEESGKSFSFVVSAFDVILNDEQRKNFIRREPEYEITSVPFYELNNKAESEGWGKELGHGVICLASKDTDLNSDLQTKINKLYLKERGGIWNWSHESGLLPADIYLRHCILAVQKGGGEAYDSFLHETYLADRKTTLDKYLEKYRDKVMNSRPPPHLANRFGG